MSARIADLDLRHAVDRANSPELKSALASLLDMCDAWSRMPPEELRLDPKISTTFAAAARIVRTAIAVELGRAMGPGRE